MTLQDYIDKHFCGIQARFADAVGVKRPQVTQWINKDFIVVDHVLYSPMDSGFIVIDDSLFIQRRDLSLGGTVGVERDD